MAGLFSFCEGKIEIESRAGHLQNPEIDYNKGSIDHAKMGTAHSRQARSEPEDGASPEAGAVGYPPGAADRTRRQAAVGSVGRARYSASEWAYP